MLVLKLRANDCVTIGDGTVVTVRRASESMLTLAIEAPEDQRITHARSGKVVSDVEEIETDPGD